MIYVTLKGLEKYMGEAYDAWERVHTEAERELERCEKRMLAYIIPNSPMCDEQKTALENAVYAQIMADAQSATAGSIPEGVESFTVNGFSATMKKSSGDIVAESGICRDARAELLYAGLLYKGVGVC